MRSFLESRGIELPEGEPSDAPTGETVAGLGNRKNAVFEQILETEGVEAYPGSVKLVKALIERGTKMAIVSSSRNAPAVLKAAGMIDHFPVIVDGRVAAERYLAGKPAPDTFLDAAAAARRAQGARRRVRGRAVRRRRRPRRTTSAW